MKAIRDEWNYACITKNNDYGCALCVLMAGEEHESNKKVIWISSSCAVYPDGKPQAILDGAECEEFDGKGLGKGSGKLILEKLPNMIFELDV